MDPVPEAITLDFQSLAVLPKAGEGEELDRDAELSRQICQAVIDEVEASRVIHEALRPVASLLPAAPVSIFLIDPSDGTLRKEGECDGGVCGDRDELPRDRGLTGVVLQTGHVVATRDPASDPRFDPACDTPSNGQIRPFLCIPLKLRGKVVGVFRGYLQEGADASARTGEVIGSALSAAVRSALLYRSLLEAIEDVAEARRVSRI
jgi:GAF domain-containing protein